MKSVRCAVQAPSGSPLLLFQVSGHTDGTGSNVFGSVDRDFDHHEERGPNPLIQQNWLALRQGSMSTCKSYEDVGVLNAIEDIAKDLLGYLAAEVTFGAGLALVVCASAELADEFDASFVGPGGLVGVAVAGGVVWTFGPSAIIAAVVAGVAAGAITDALIRHRQLTDEEYAFATLVFGDTLPPRERIYVTNLSHGCGHKYTWPNVDDSVLLNLDDAFDHPMTHQLGKHGPGAAGLSCRQLVPALRRRMEGHGRPDRQARVAGRHPGPKICLHRQSHPARYELKVQPPALRRTQSTMADALRNSSTDRAGISGKR
jgi:hypothetical protein